MEERGGNMAHLEKEYKNILTKKQYETLKEAYHSIFTKNITQTNQYYDDNQQLENNRCALRIRIIEGNETGEVTLKIPQSEYEIVEITEKFPTTQLQEWIEEKTFPLPTSIQTVLEEKNISLSQVTATATLTTHRLEGLLQPGIFLVLDENHYANQTDYEIEMEVDDLVEGKKIFLEILHIHNISPQKTMSKIRRALQAYKKIS